MNRSPRLGSDFFREYHGHRVDHLETLYQSLRPPSPSTSRPLVWLAGDSSLDNKYWIKQWMPAANGYENVLSPPQCKADVTHYLNAELTDYTTVNCAVEESTLADRAGARLLPQDEFIRDHIGPEDVLVVSVGGNDIALRPSLGTIWNILLTLKCNSKSTLRKGPAHVWGMNHFVRMFHTGVEQYISKLVSKQRPKMVLVCMIYHPDEEATGSWADRTLGALGYNRDPEKLQIAIEQIYEHATKKVQIEGTEVVPVPLFEVLNGKDSSMYVDRVEPSCKGGELMAARFGKEIRERLGSTHDSR